MNDLQRIHTAIADRTAAVRAQQPALVESPTPPRGQVIVLFAIFLVGMLGLLGLATDLGFAFAQRRTVQTAADSAAMAGARAVAKSLPGNLLPAWPEAAAMVAANRLGSSQGGVQRCDYVNDADVALSSCANNPPLAATGVRVVFRETHSTFFVQAVPGAPNAVTTAATATAHVQAYDAPTDGPFLVCGTHTQLASGGNMDILLGGASAWTVNPAADGQVFQIHGPQIEKCEAKSSRFKGVANGPANKNRSYPDWFFYTEGDTAGTLYADVPGVQGCKAGEVVNNCVAFLPISLNDPPEAGNNKQLWTVAFLPFFITEPKSNEHHGRLLLNYIVRAPGKPGWVRGTPGAVVVRLTD